MKLNLKERLMVLSVLPKEGNYVTLKIVKNLTESLAISEKEWKEFDVKNDGQTVTWNEKGNEEVEIELGEQAIKIVKNSLKELDEKEKITNDHYSIYEKFVGV